MGFPEDKSLVASFVKFYIIVCDGNILLNRVRGR